MALGVVALDWITADEEYGRNGEFLDELETLGHRYVVEVPVNTTVWTEDPAGVRPALRRSGPGADAAEPRVGAERGRGGLGTAGPRAGGRCRSVRGPRGRLASSSPRCGSGRCVTAKPARRSGCWCGGRLEATPEIKYYVSNGDAATPLGVLAQVACTRHEVEEYLRGRQELPGDGAVRDAVVDRLAPSHESGGDGSSVHYADAPRSQKKTPELTLDRTVRLLQRAIEVPGLSLEVAVLLVDYHIDRNGIARNSHMKSWMLKHGSRIEKFVPL